MHMRTPAVVPSSLYMMSGYDRLPDTQCSQNLRLQFVWLRSLLPCNASIRSIVRLLVCRQPRPHVAEQILRADLPIYLIKYLGEKPPRNFPKTLATRCGVVTQYP
eukprot:COSAG01_NODE_26249_length_719_cov_159.617742_1_plen_105_part_00